MLFRSNDTATTEIYTLSLHDALPISSAHNWQGLAWALRGEQISNFPICNKSFNLSYCGTDR